MTVRGDALLQRYYSGRVAPSFFAHLFKAVAKQHHRELIPLFRRLITDDAIVFDVGAHAGQFTKLFARLATNGFVFAFEPQSYARRLISTAIRVNRLANVALLPIALGDAPGMALLSLPIKASGSYGFGLASLAAAAGGRKVEIEAVAVATVDQCATVLGLRRLDLIKADIEGAELMMLRGARRTVETLRPALYLELDQSRLAPAGATMEEAWEFLRERDYVAHLPSGARLSRPQTGDILFLPAEKSPLLLG